MDRESEFVCLVVYSNLLSFLFSSGKAFQVSSLFFCLFVLSFLCPFKIRRMCECGCLGNLTYSANGVCVFFFCFFQEALLSALSCVCINCR